MTNQFVNTPIGPVHVPEFIQGKLREMSDVELKTELITQINKPNGFIDPHLVGEVEHRRMHVPELYQRRRTNSFEKAIDNFIANNL